MSLKLSMTLMFEKGSKTPCNVIVGREGGHCSESEVVFMILSSGKFPRRSPAISLPEEGHWGMGVCSSITPTAPHRFGEIGLLIHDLSINHQIIIATIHGAQSHNAAVHCCADMHETMVPHLACVRGSTALLHPDGPDAWQGERVSQTGTHVRPTNFRARTFSTSLMSLGSKWDHHRPH